jgi:hypothetical protein
VKPFYLSSETVLPFKRNLYRYVTDQEKTTKSLLSSEEAQRKAQEAAVKSLKVKSTVTGRAVMYELNPVDP